MPVPKNIKGMIDSAEKKRKKKGIDLSKFKGIKLPKGLTKKEEKKKD